jgi:transcriptional regulator with XRE-family HTH domain
VDKKRLKRQQAVLQMLLRETRQAAGLRQQDLAERLGEPQPFVSRYESGERRLTILELRWICEILGVPFLLFVQQLEQRLSDETDASR